MTNETMQLQFVSLMNGIANYDNINFPTLKFTHDLCFCSIIFPEGSKISASTFEVLQKHYNYISSIESVHWTYKVVSLANKIHIEVELKIK